MGVPLRRLCKRCSCCNRRRRSRRAYTNGLRPSLLDGCLLGVFTGRTRAPYDCVKTFGVSATGRSARRIPTLVPEEDFDELLAGSQAATALLCV